MHVFCGHGMGAQLARQIITLTGCCGEGDRLEEKARIRAGWQAGWLDGWMAELAGGLEFSWRAQKGGDIADMREIGYLKDISQCGPVYAAADVTTIKYTCATECNEWDAQESLTSSPKNMV
jgi:hypothetical protein